ncbi:MAG: nicotinate-nucleotide adenylyltransferase [Clostridia bacterium]|nr:nicotinate-nucleotide adenylyltransferase [Clostridia bacterium]
MKVALFGGTFDPIHNGHVALCESFARQLGLDYVLLMPTAHPPHKLKTEMASAAHRLVMCELVAKEHPSIRVSDLEIRRGGASFTVDTLEELHRREPDTEWYLITGADMFLTLGTWFRFPDIARLATLCAAPRGDVTREQMEAYADTLKAAGARCIVTDIHAPGVSSTEIRALIRQGDPAWKADVPAAVADYIESHDLYRPGAPSEAPSTDEQFTDIIRRRLTPYRFAHSVAVAEEARRLAHKYGADPGKAYTAGLLHDILKDASPAEQLQIAADFGILLDDTEQASQKLWHAHVGAVFVEKILGVTDPEIIGAIRYHTTARAHMTLLEKIIYIADFTAAGRDYDDVDVMRRLADQSLEAAMRYALEYTVADLHKKHRTVHPDTLAALQEVSSPTEKG